jgi:hypothetical protein
VTCSALAAAEPLGATAPTDTAWLFVEHPGPWAAKAAAELGLSSPGVRVQLIRRHGRTPAGGVRLFAATVGPAVSVRTAVVPSLDRVDRADWVPHDDPLLLVCTHGRRDRCCAELGRPVAAALTERWPDATWETTHLGGHRFAGALLALPSGIALGRLTAASAVPACEALLAGRLPDPAVVRGRAGLPGPVQAAELAAFRELGLRGLSDVSVTGTDGDRVSLHTPAGTVEATATTAAGVPRQQSCGDQQPKQVLTHTATLSGPPRGGGSAAPRANG